MRERLADWLRIRPSEVRTVALSAGGSFLAIAFLILARSLREALYLTTYPVETLPYITAAVAVLSVPTVAAFARRLGRGDPQTVLLRALAALAGLVTLLWPLVSRSGAAVVAFYLVTALGTILLTSGFWLVTAELFPVRGAKRLFGLIGAGGTAGAMVTGNALAWLTGRLEITSFVPGLPLILGLFLLVQVSLPRLERSGEGAERPGSVREGLALAWRTPHLRTIALVVATATVASTLLDYQFKELARATFTTGESLAGFFGAFYGWTGAASLAIQLLAAAPLMASAGLAATLSILPALLLLGSAGLLIAPALALVTVVRGGDNALRKSLHRSALEVLYVPLPAELRRRTKTFVDSVADSTAEGVGAGIVFLVVTLGGAPSRFLSLGVLGLAGALLWLAGRAGRSYGRTVREQLEEGVRATGPGAEQRDLLGGGFTHVDVRPALEETGVTVATADLTPDAHRAAALLARTPDRVPVVPAAEAEVRSAAEGSAGETLRLAFAGAASGEVLRRLRAVERWEAEQVPDLVRLLARDPLYPEVVESLARAADEALPYLAERLSDPGVDFVIRRRIPRVLARYARVEADEALLAALTAPRFEVRYRAAIALVRRRRERYPTVPADEAAARVWEAIRAELSRGRPVWELQRLLDDEPQDDFVARRVGVRGALSLEHTFRLLSLVLEPETVKSAYHGVMGDDARLGSLALEYLEQVLPADVRERMWPFIGDLSEYRRSRTERPLNQVVADLVTTDATLFASEVDRDALQRLLEEEGE